VLVIGHVATRWGLDHFLRGELLENLTEAGSAGSRAGSTGCTWAPDQMEITSSARAGWMTRWRSSGMYATVTELACTSVPDQEQVVAKLKV
jgi:hypothetical protein